MSLLARNFVVLNKMYVKLLLVACANILSLLEIDLRLCPPNWNHSKLIIKGASENRRLFDRKIRLLELDDFGDSNANWNANGRKKCAVSET